MASKNCAHIRIFGPDHKGIIASITQAVFENGGNIEDIDQRILEGILTMNMLVDFSGAPSPKKQIENTIEKRAEAIRMKAQILWKDEKRVKQVAVLVTKEPHCLLDLIKNLKKTPQLAEISCVIGNHRELEPIAKKHNLPFYFIDSTNKKEHETKILNILDERKIDCVVLARYMQILSPEFVFRYEGRIINIHPSLLPAFPGPKSYEQAYNKGVEYVGVTAHFVTTQLDEGPIITQDCFRLDKSKDSLETIIGKGQAIEAKVLTKAVTLFLKDRLLLRRGKVIDNRHLKKIDSTTKKFYEVNL